jgi:hypothetical protein
MPFTAQLLGVPELAATLAEIGAMLPGELQDANEQVGPKILDRAYPTPLAVGSGSGASPQPDAAGRTLAITAGGPWRAAHVPGAPWGSIEGSPRGSPRPFLLRAIEDQLPEIEAAYLHGVFEAAAKTGWPPTQMIGF